MIVAFGWHHYTRIAQYAADNGQSVSDIVNTDGGEGGGTAATAQLRTLNNCPE